VPRRHRAPVPLPPQPDTPYMVFTAHDTAQGLKTGARRTFDFLRGIHDQANDMVNPLKIYEGLHEFGQHEAAIYIPDPDGHTEDGDAFARKLGRDTLNSLNPLVWFCLRRPRSRLRRTALAQTGTRPRCPPLGK